ncbi:hypothetical protein GY24_01940 [Microterricola pindariensis]|uniref:Uncharacterized protein n=1 Tax=Microterricola pindariensis TaxID=478010 RepID=A0ABX5AZJ2_9MICO|nr:hypothetical protein GY24_01940 [Microterricola pindariensis]
MVEAGAQRAAGSFARRRAASSVGPSSASPTTVVTARTVSQVSVELTSEYRANEARFVPSGAPAS